MAVCFYISTLKTAIQSRLPPAAFFSAIAHLYFLFANEQSSFYLVRPYTQKAYLA
jgi:hypothetical protein